MLFTPGTGATITAVTLENQFYTLMSMIQGVERDASKNDKGVNILSYTIVNNNVQIPKNFGICILIAIALFGVCPFSKFYRLGFVSLAHFSFNFDKPFYDKTNVGYD